MVPRLQFLYATRFDIFDAAIDTPSLIGWRHFFSRRALQARAGAPCYMLRYMRHVGFTAPCLLLLPPDAPLPLPPLPRHALL